MGDFLKLNSKVIVTNPNQTYPTYQEAVVARVDTSKKHRWIRHSCPSVGDVGTIIHYFMHPDHLSEVYIVEMDANSQIFVIDSAGLDSLDEPASSTDQELLKKAIPNGTKIKIINMGSCYDQYEKAITRYMPSRITQWKKWDLPNNGAIGTVLESFIDLGCNFIIYIVEIRGLDSSQLFVMSEGGIEVFKLKPTLNEDFKVGDVVIIDNLEFEKNHSPSDTMAFQIAKDFKTALTVTNIIPNAVRKIGNLIVATSPQRSFLVDSRSLKLIKFSKGGEQDSYYYYEE